MTRVFKVDRPNYANFTVQVVTSPTAADLLVYQADQPISQTQAEGVWTFVDEPEVANASIYFTPPGRGGAQLNICYVNSAALSGWMRHHRLKGRLSRFRMASRTA